MTLLRCSILLLFLCPSATFASGSTTINELTSAMQIATSKGDYAELGRLSAELIQALEHSDHGDPESKAAARNQLGVYYQATGNYPEAERNFKVGIRELDRAGVPLKGLEVLLLNLASLQLETGGRAAEAEAASRRALQVAERRLAPGDTEMARYLNVLAVSRQEQGDRLEAKKLFERSLGYGSQTAEDKSRNALILCNLAVLEAQSGNLVLARDYLTQGIALVEQTSGPAHPSLARIYFNLADVQQQLRQWPAARGSLDRAQSIVELKMGASHPLLALILSSQATVERRSGHTKLARELERKAKSILSAQPKDAASQSVVHVGDLVPAKRR